MRKIIKSEFNHLRKETQSLDIKVITVFISSTILIILSWYFSNPKFFAESFTFIKPEDLLVEELISFIFWFIFDFILFFIIPLYFIKLVFKDDLVNFGFSFGHFQTGIFYTFLSLIVFIPIIYLISKSSEFSKYFPLMQNAKDDLFIFFIYETLFIVFIYSWEFFFRGFMLFGLEKKFGLYSIFIQMIPFALLHSGKPFIETFASIFGGLFLGFLALRTRSIIYGFLIHAIILVTLDLIAIIEYSIF